PTGGPSMHAFTRFRFTAFGLVALAALLFLPDGAMAAKTDHANFDDTFPANVCGIDVVTHVVGVFNGFQYATDAGLPLFKGTVHQTVTWTNPANGQALIDTTSGMFKDFRAVDNGDGTVTIFTAQDGQPNVLSLPDGTVLAHARGRIIFATVWDFNGTPGDRSDDGFVSQSIAFDAGSHPFAEGTL